jgi:hypothetical protein
MEIRTLYPRELLVLAEAGRDALGLRSAGFADLLAYRRNQGLVSGILAGDEIVAAALFRVNRDDGAPIGQIHFLVSFVGDDELDRRLKWRLVSGLEVTFWGLGASRLEVFTEEDGDLGRMLHSAGYVAVPTDRSPMGGSTLPRVRLVKVRPRRGDRQRCSFVSFPHAPADARVASRLRGKTIVQKDEQTRRNLSGAYPVRPRRRHTEGALDGAQDVH